MRIIRRGSGSVVTWRRAQMVLLSARGMDVPAIAKVAFTSEDRVRDVIRNFSADGFSSLYPKYKGGHPPKFTLAQRREIKKLAKSKPMPAFLTAATREAHLLGMLAAAAEAFQRRGERLVLVVDGLDEDRGVTTGPDAHSIAALLPTWPGAGLRIIAAGRPHPPIPADVPDDHPLRDPGIVRMLGRSSWAEVVKADMQRELKRLLHGTPAEQDLLGLVTAAGGGLTGPGLAELTGLPVYDVEENLHAVAGRTFTTRPARWQRGIAPPVYVLGHEELQTAATASLGDTRLVGYRQRLHTGADEYRQQDWPSGTPEYLLRGYFQMLQATSDTTRLVACALDRARHDRMLDLTGGEAAGLAEIITAQEAILAQDDPDLAAAIRLARHRDDLAARTHIPITLPSAWAARGQHARAEALARSLTDADEQARVLSELAGALVQAGQHQQAETMARSHTDPYYQAQALSELIGALARAGQHEQAAQVAAQAETAARSLTDPDDQVWALAAVAGALAQVGQPEQAIQIAAQAETIARSFTDPDGQAWALAAVAEALARSASTSRPP